MNTVASAVNRKLVSYTSRLIATGLPVLYFLIAVAFYLKTYDSAQIKITLVQIGGTILIAAWLIKAIENEFDFFRKNLAAILPLLLFLASGIFSFTHSPFPLASANELVRRVIYIGLALIVASEFNSEASLRRLFKWLIAAVLVTGVYGVVQYLDYKFFPGPPEPGLDPFIWRRAFGPRVFSTFGNPNFFGDFLVVMSPVVLDFYLRFKRFSLLLLWGVVAFCTAFTYSKGAWLGFAVGLIVFAFLAVMFFSHANKARLRKILFSMAAATIIIVSIGMAHQLKGRPDSSSFRIFTWLSTCEMIKTHPWIGTGLGTFYVTYPSWRRPQIFFIEGRHNTETDHPEDEFLEVWYDEGYIGFGVFLLLLAACLTMGFRSLREFSKAQSEGKKADIRSYYLLGILTAVIAQLAHNLVCVSLRFVSSGVMLWLMIGLIVGLTVNDPLKADEDNPVKNSRLPLFVRRSLQILVAGAAVWFVLVFYGYFDGDMKHNQAIFFSKSARWQEALERYETVVKENPSFIMTHYFMGNVYNDRWAPGDPDKAVAKYNDVWKLAPNYVQSHHQAGLIYLKWGEEEKRKAAEARNRGDMAAAAKHENAKTELWQKALAQFERYRAIDPIFPLNYYRIAWIHQEMGQPDKAEDVYKAHLEYPEKLKQPPHNAWVEDWTVRRRDEYAETYLNLGNLRYMNNDLDGAEKYYERSIELSPNSVNALKNLATVYARKGRMDKAGEVWQQLRKTAPNDPDVQRMFVQPQR